MCGYYNYKGICMLQLSMSGFAWYILELYYVLIFGYAYMTRPKKISLIYTKSYLIF